VKFPVTIKHRASKAKVYAPAKNFPYYRLGFAVAGKRRMQTFATYSEAREAGERIVREIAQGSSAASLSAGQSQDALAALERLDAFRQSTGRKFSLLGAISEFVEAAGKLRGRTLGEAVAGYLRTVVTVQRKDIGEAVTEFLAGSEHLTRAANGQRAQLSAKYAYNREIQLRKFAGTFTGTLVCDLSKEHLDKFISTLGEQATKSRNRRKIVSAKSRNHYRGAIRQFLQWAVRKDYLSPTHRLFEADAMRPEHANTAEIEFYTAGELARMLSAAKDTLRPLVAIGALAGLRTAELLRLDWADVWRVPGHIEIVAVKSKTRQRRLVEICPALETWLEPCRANTGKLWTGHEICFQQKLVKLCEDAKAPRKHNGLRAVGKITNNAFRFGFGFAKRLKIANATFPSSVIGDAIIMVIFASPVNGRLKTAMFDDFWKAHFPAFSFRQKLCGNCAGITRTFNSLVKCGAYSRT
jgi:integrase